MKEISVGLPHSYYRRPDLKFLYKFHKISSILSFPSNLLKSFELYVEDKMKMMIVALLVLVALLVESNAAGKTGGHAKGHHTTGAAGTGAKPPSGAGARVWKGSYAHHGAPAPAPAGTA